MKNKVFPVLLVFIFMLLLGSCATEMITFDESLQENEYALIHFNARLEITEFNGIAVNWKPPSALLSSGLELRIPGGQTHFTLNGRVGTQNMGYTIYRDVPFVFNFENGKEYSLFVNQNLISIYDGKSSSTKNHIVTFNMNNGQKSIYEYGKRVQ